MAVDLELIPYTGKRWPKKATFIRQGPEYHIRNWNTLFDIILHMEGKSLPDNMALVMKDWKEHDYVSSGSPLSGEGLKYLPASKVVSALKKAIKKWVPVDPKWAEEDADAYKRMQKILSAMKRLKPSTPVILYWW